MSQQKKVNLIFGIVLILIVVLGVSLTSYFIIRHNQSVDKKEVVHNNEEDEYIPFLVFDEVSHKETVDFYKEYPVNPIDINFVGTVKIDGLKDQTIEDKVNQILGELPALESEDSYGCLVNFNVSNVLSIQCDGKSRNVNLVTGEEIKLEELFNKDTEMDALIRNEAYQSVCSFLGCYIDEEFDTKFESQVENRVVDFLNDFKNNQSDLLIDYASFSILSESNPWYYYSSYAPYIDELTIYDRFLTNDDIYENEVTLTCMPQDCYDVILANESEDEDSFRFSGLLNNTNYFDFDIYNGSDYNPTNQSFQKYPFDMKIIGEKVKKQLIDKLNLEDIDHYKNITLNAHIYNNELNGYQLDYSLIIQTLEEEEFYKAILGYELVNEIEHEEFYKMDIIMDQNGNISFLDDDPTVFEGFEDKLYLYIMDDLAREDFEENYYSSFSNYNYGKCELSSVNVNECLENRDFHELIKEANYAIDPVNQRIHMYHLIPGIGMAQSYVNVYLPFSMFVDTNEGN